MSTKNLVYHAYDASSLPVDGVDVTLECFASDGSRSVFYGTLHLLAPYTGTTGADGSVTINNVPANADCDDPYSYYLFTARGVLELTAGGGQGYFDQFYVVVPHSGSSPIDISTIKRDAPPTPGGSTPLHDQTSHQGDIWPDATDQVAGTSTLQIAQQASGGVSAPPAGSRKLFVRDSDGHFALMKSDSSVVDLEAGGSGLSGGTPALTLSTSNSGGVAATGVRTDATIAAFDATAPVTQAFADAAAAGSAGFAARRDHKHGMPADPTAGQLVLSGAVTNDTTTGAITDLAITNTVYRWNGITAATIHGITGVAEGRVVLIENISTTQTLTLAHQSATEGTATRRIINPDAADSPIGPLASVLLEYDNTTGRWRVIAESTYTTAAAAIGTASAGTAGTLPPRGDHVHPTGAGTPATVGTANSTGSGPAAAMTDHVHAHEAAHIQHDTTWAAKGDLIAGTANDTAAVLTAGADDTILMADSAQSTGLKWVASATPSTQALGDAAAVGTADTFTRGDHKHAMPSATTTASGLQMSTARLLGRTTASTGAIEEISAGSTLSLSAGSLDLASAGHGATQHTDITRSIWLTPAHQAGNAGDGGSLAVQGTAFPEKIAVWTLADAATQGFIETFMMPADAKAATLITVVVYWEPQSTDASSHTVRWSMELRVIAAGDAIDAAGTTTAWTGDSAARTAKNLVIESGQTGLTSTSANDMIRFDLRRIGADAADTYVGGVGVVGVRIDYTATQ